MRIPLPEDIPFEGPQKMWLRGFLDGLSATLAQGAGGTAVAEPPVAAPPAGVSVTILWGSQTGTSESLAKKLGKSLTTKGHIVTIKDMVETEPGDLPSTGHLLVITSTYGDGEPPDNAASLHAALLRDDALDMSALKFSVLALGDSSYPDFCKCGHDFDQRLATLGATRLCPIVECDGDPDDGFASWSAAITETLGTLAATR